MRCGGFNNWGIGRGMREPRRKFGNERTPSELRVDTEEALEVLGPPGLEAPALWVLTISHQ